MTTRRGTLTEIVMRYIVDHPGRSAFQIAEGIQHPSGSVSSILCKARKLGLVFESRLVLGPRGGLTYFASLEGRNAAERFQ